MVFFGSPSSFSIPMTMVQWPSSFFDAIAPQINETLSEAMEKFNKKIANLRKSTDSAPSNASFSSSDSGKIPSLYQQAAAEICFEGAEILAQGDINGKSIMPSGIHTLMDNVY